MIIILLIIMVIVSKLWQVGGFKKSKLKFCANERGKKKLSSRLTKVTTLYLRRVPG